MRTPGAFPVGLFTDDLTIERELLEAPSDEPTQLGGWERRPAHSLAELLDSWHDATWGGEA